jgi:hypothetical protein
MTASSGPTITVKPGTYSAKVYFSQPVLTQKNRRTRRWISLSRLAMAISQILRSYRLCIRPEATPKLEQAT